MKKVKNLAWGSYKIGRKGCKRCGRGVREVTPFIRVRVVGLTSNGHSRKCRSREGLITIWNPTEKLVTLMPFLCAISCNTRCSQSDLLS